MDKKQFFKSNYCVIITVLFLTFTVFFYAPFEVYLQNTGEFWCNLRMIWWIPTMIGIGSFLLLSFIGSLIKNEKFKKVYAILAFAGGLCAYIQGNFLNMKLGLMDGRKIDWPSFSRPFRINLGIWMVIIVAFLCLGIWKGVIVEKICRYVSILLIGMQLAALISLLIPVIKDGGLSSESKTFSSSDHLWEIGEDENVVVLVLDSYDQNYLRQLVDEKNPILDELDGFTYFSNYSGLFRSTAYGIVPLLTGDAFYNQADWNNKIETMGTFYDDLVKQDYDIDVYTEMWFDIPAGSQNSVRNLITAPIVMDGVRLKATELIYRLAWCKYLPDYAKCYLWLYGPEFEGFERYDSDSEVFNWYNGPFRDGLEQNGLTVSSGRQFKFIHLYGAHEPYFTGKDLEDVPENWDIDSIPQGAMRLATNYIEALKKAGVYDKTTMIITSDHGCTHEPGLISNSILLIKEKGSNGPLQVSEAPVSEADFGATIVDLIGGDTVYEGEVSALKVPEDAVRDRKYYGYLFTDADTIATRNGSNYILVEYDVDNDDPSTTKFKLTGKGYLPGGRVYEHKDYCKTCQEGIEPVVENNWMYWEHIETKGLE